MAQVQTTGPGLLEDNRLYLKSWTSVARTGVLGGCAGGFKDQPFYGLPFRLASPFAWPVLRPGRRSRVLLRRQRPGQRAAQACWPRPSSSRTGSVLGFPWRLCMWVGPGGALKRSSRLRRVTWGWTNRDRVRRVASPHSQAAGSLWSRSAAPLRYGGKSSSALARLGCHARTWSCLETWPESGVSRVDSYT